MGILKKLGYHFADGFFEGWETSANRVLPKVVTKDGGEGQIAVVMGAAALIGLSKILSPSRLVENLLTSEEELQKRMENRFSD